MDTKEGSTGSTFKLWELCVLAFLILVVFIFGQTFIKNARALGKLGVTAEEVLSK